MLRSPLLILLLCMVLSFARPTPGRADGPQVVASVHPIHSLVAGVMEGVSTPELLLPPGASPHSFALRPTDAQMLEHARVLFWVGPELETFLVKPLQTLAADTHVVELGSVAGLVRHPVRPAGVWGASGSNGDTDGKTEDVEQHEHDDENEPEHAHDHEHGAFDSHMWLDPENAAVWVRAIATALTEVDPAHGETYRRNAQALERRLAGLVNEVAKHLTPVKETPYLVFHDAYQYFEKRFGLAPAGALTVNPDMAPSARRVAKLRNTVRETGAVCVFAEPQFEPALVRVVVEDTDARIGTLDPLGAALPAGPDHYFTLIENLAKSLADCLAG